MSSRYSAWTLSEIWPLAPVCRADPIRIPSIGRPVAARRAGRPPGPFTGRAGRRPRQLAPLAGRRGFYWRGPRTLQLRQSGRTLRGSRARSGRRLAGMTWPASSSDGARRRPHCAHWPADRTAADRTRQARPARMRRAGSRHAVQRPPDPTGTSAPQETHGVTISERPAAPASGVPLRAPGWPRWPGRSVADGERPS